MEQRIVPNRNERVTLIQAGIGEKNITFDEFRNSQEIHSELIHQYPDKGGFELLHVAVGRYIVPPKNGYLKLTIVCTYLILQI